jgi:hypothetical protein
MDASMTRLFSYTIPIDDGAAPNPFHGIARDIQTKISRARTMTTRRKSPKKPESFAAGVVRGMRRAARTAREVARMHQTPIYVWEDGKVAAKKP